MMATAVPRYTKFMIVVHWTTAVLVIGAYLFSKGARQVRIAPPTLHWRSAIACMVALFKR
jgi:superoxide oxidase